MGSRVFLSYSSRDKDNVRRLADDLTRSGVDVWLDELQIGVGDRITQKVQEGLDGSDYLAVWLTKQSVESGWVEREWQSQYEDEIESRRKILLPLLAEDCNLPRLLRGRKYADFRYDYQKGLIDLLRVVGPSDWENELGMKFTFILPGTFLMGSEDGEENERPVCQVSISRAFYMSRYVVTQQEWKEIMHTEPWKGGMHVREGNRYPAVNITWFDARDFLNLLSRLDNKNKYYLPKEEEWEYAARAGTNTAFSFGDDERDMRIYGWYHDLTQNAEEYAHEVGLKVPNPWGLYDMHGNVWEWTDSWYYGSYAAKPRLDAAEKVVRGGGWDYPAKGSRSSFRNYLLPTRSNHSIGFRLVRGA
jgi:formylglycine-generating enzyme required for sulfatase activity